MNRADQMQGQGTSSIVMHSKRVTDDSVTLSWRPPTENVPELRGASLHHR